MNHLYHRGLIAILGLALCLYNTSCIGYHVYERQVSATKAACVRAEQAEAYAADADACYNENQHLLQRNALLQSELASTRLQYGQLEHANADLLYRYDRYITLTDREVNANASERARLSDAASRREREAHDAHQKVIALNTAVVERDAQLALARGQASSQLVPKPTALGEYEPSATRRTPAPRNVEPRMAEVCAELSTYIRAQLTGFLPSELRVFDYQEWVSIELSQAMLFPGAGQELGTLGMAALRQLVRALEGIALVSVHVSNAASDPAGTAANTRLCPACAKTVAEALVTAGLPQAKVIVAQYEVLPENYDDRYGGETLLKPGTITITFKPVLPKGDRHSLSGLPPR